MIIQHNPLVCLGTFIFRFECLLFYLLRKFTMRTKCSHDFTSCFPGTAKRRSLVTFRFFPPCICDLGPTLLSFMCYLPQGQAQMNSQIASNTFYLVTFSQKLCPESCYVKWQILSCPKGIACSFKKCSASLLHVCCAL